jgi:hypothetical protein
MWRRLRCEDDNEIICDKKLVVGEFKMLGRMAVCIKNLSGYLKATGIRNWNLLNAQSDELRTLWGLLRTPYIRKFLWGYDSKCPESRGEMPIVSSDVELFKIVYRH